MVVHSICLHCNYIPMAKFLRLTNSYLGIHGWSVFLFWELITSINIIKWNIQLYHLVTFSEIFLTLVKFFNHISFIPSNEYIYFFLKFLFLFFNWTFNYFKTTIFWKCKPPKFIYFSKLFHWNKVHLIWIGFNLWNLSPKSLHSSKTQLPKWESISRTPKHFHIHLGECFILSMSQLFALTMIMSPKLIVTNTI